MSTVALLASPGKLLGFLLIAGDGSLQDGPSERDCIFSGVPSDPSLFDHELGAFVQAMKHIEFPCKIGRQGSATSLSIDVTPDTSVCLQVPQAGFGQWYVLREGQQSVLGACELAAV